MNSQAPPPDCPRNALPSVLALLLIAGIIIGTLVLAHHGQSAPAGYGSTVLQ